MLWVHFTCLLHSYRRPSRNRKNSRQFADCEKGKVGVAERGKKKGSRKKEMGGGAKKEEKETNSLFFYGETERTVNRSLCPAEEGREPFLLCLMSHFLGSAEDKERRRKGATACRKGG